MPPPQDPDFAILADIEVDAVRPLPAGFVLEGRGADMADYRLHLHLDMPLDDRTRTVLAELLAQSEWQVRRRVRTSLKRRARARAEAEPR